MTTNSNSPAIYALTARGLELALHLRATLGGVCFAPQHLAEGVADARGFVSLSELVAAEFNNFGQHIFITAAGIAVRCIAPLVADKTVDPAVLVLDQRGAFVVSLLSGHLGGANALAERVAGLVGGVAVITTATDTEGLPAADLLAAREGLRIGNPGAVRAVNAAFLAGERVGLYDPEAWLRGGMSVEELQHFELLADAAALDDFWARKPRGTVVRVSWKKIKPSENCLWLIPPALCFGVGCRRGAGAEEVLGLVRETCAAEGWDARATACLASAKIKEDEPGLVAAARELGVSLRVFVAEELAPYPPMEVSVKALEAVGLPGVCEPAARAAAGGGRLLVKKRISGPVTLAAALVAPGKKAVEAGDISAAAPEAGGKLYVCGLGPGDASLLTPQAEAALRESEEIFGYATYVDLLPSDILAGKAVRRGRMGGEVERCAAALRAAAAGRRVCLVSSGDAGIYGMAGLVLELAETFALEDETYVPPEVEIIPGVPALCAAAARLGAPLMHDFAVISLSDLLTPWELIEKRVTAAAEADFVLVLYNPSSRGRGEKFARVWALLRELCGDERPYGLAREVFRPGERVSAGRLSDLDPNAVDMLSLVIVGNSQTRLSGGRLITPRGYLSKYHAERAS